MEKSERVDLHTVGPLKGVMQQNHGQSSSPGRVFQPYPDAQSGQETGMGTPGMFHNASLEKQMAALNAANLAKMANRSAPGSAQSPVLAQSSSGYFGGNSLLHQSNGNMTAPNMAIPSPSDQHLQSSSISDFSTHSAQQQGPSHSGFQQNMNVQPPHSMSISTPSSTGQQNAFPDPNHRSTPVPNQQAQMQQMQKRKQFIQTLGSLMLQRGQPLPMGLTGVPIPPGMDPNVSPWKSLEPSQTEVGAIRLAGKDFDLYKFFGLVFQNGGGMKVHQAGAWHNFLQLFDLPEQLPPPYSRPTAQFLAQLYMGVLVAFEEWYRKNSIMNKGNNQYSQRHLSSTPSSAAGTATQQPPQQQPNQQIQNSPQRIPPQHQPHQQPHTPTSGMNNMQGSQFNPMGMSQAGMNPNVGNIGMGGMPGMGNMTVPATPDPAIDINGMNNTFGGQPVAQSHVQIQGGAPGLPDDSSQLALGMMQHVQSQQPTHGQPGAPQQPGLTPNLHQGMDQNFFATQPQLHQQQLGHLTQSSTTPINGPPPTTLGDFGSLDMDMETRKRKVEEEEEVKRARQKTGELPDMPPSMRVATPSVPSQPSTIARTRRKITYVPLHYEVDSAGGRNILHVGPELQRALSHRPLKAIHEWGQVDIDALVMSIRSRLGTELSYAITTCSLISVVRDAAKDVPYLTIPQCPDLFEELLDLLEESAFQGAEDADDEFDDCGQASGPMDLLTIRDLLEIIQEEETKPFACLRTERLGEVDHSSGTQQRPGGVVLSVLNIFRNWAAASGDNLDFMARHPTFTSIMLRLCGLASRKNGNTKIRPASPVLSLSDLVTVRKDVALIMIGVAVEYRLKDVYERSPPVGKRVTRRMVGFVSSALMDPPEVCSLSSLWSVPATADYALQIWTRFSHPDEHRKIIASVIPQAWLGELFRSFVHRCPVSNKDFEVITKDMWLGYVEKLMMAIYSLAFLAPPELKKRLKADKSIGFSGVMLRILRKFITNPSGNIREFFHISSKRAVEAMKLIDDEGEVVVDKTPTTSMPALSFGMGWHETGEKKVESGFGILGGFSEEITLSIMFAREVDNIMFNELESMIRVEF